MHMCLLLPVTWIFTRSRLSDSAQSSPFIKNYYLIIVAFSRPHFSIYAKESTLVSTQGLLTLTIVCFIRFMTLIIDSDKSAGTITIIIADHFKYFLILGNIFIPEDNMYSRLLETSSIK